MIFGVHQFPGFTAEAPTAFRARAKRLQTLIKFAFKLPQAAVGC
jgi:hypothetical protein